MNPSQSQEIAITHVLGCLPPRVAKAVRVVHSSDETRWEPHLLRSIRSNELAILTCGADFLVFFDDSGREIGWREDGVHGSTHPEWVDPHLLRQRVIDELDLAPDTPLGHARPVELPPLGWTCEITLFVGNRNLSADVVRAWLEPHHLRVIQCLFGPAGVEAL